MCLHKGITLLLFYPGLKYGTRKTISKLLCSLKQVFVIVMKCLKQMQPGITLDNPAEKSYLKRIQPHYEVRIII